MRRHRRDRVRRQRGFIISVELILIFTLLVIGSLVGVIAVRNAIVRLVESHRAAKVVVKDSSVPPLILGKPVGYDLCEAPQILCRDFGFDENNNGVGAMPGPSDGLKALVGVRPDRFVTRNQIYFEGDDCSGAAYLAPPPIPGSPNFPPVLPVGYYNCGIQIDAAGDHVCYGAGPPSNWPCGLGTTCVDGGRLYRSDGTTTSMPTIRSRWVSLRPDCAELGSAEGENLVVNGSFELPSFAGNGDFSPQDGPLPLGWTVTPPTSPFGPAGHEDPCVVGELAPCTNIPPIPSYTVFPPDGKQLGYSNGSGGFPGTPELTQSVVLAAGDMCTFEVWIGCHTDANCALNPTPPSFTVDIVDAVGTGQFAPVSGTLGPLVPEWQKFTRMFTVTGPTPHVIRLESSGDETNFDAITLTCGQAICDDSFETTALDLLPAVEVTDMSGANLLAPYMPLFNVMPPMPPMLTLTPPVPEATPAVPPTGNLTPPEPEAN